MTTSDWILAVYIALLVAGGLIGFVKAKSKMSLLMSLAFALPLALSLVLHFRPMFSVALLAVLSAFFGMRFLKSKKLMPAGLMAVLSLATLAARVLLV